MVSVNKETGAAQNTNEREATPVGDAPKRAVNVVGALAAPADCAHRNAADDGALAAASLAVHLRTMDAQVVQDLVRARELAAGVTRSFPGGDERFAEMSDSEGEEMEVDEDNADDDDGADPCVGLFDDKVDPSAHASLARAKDESGLDLLAEMRTASMPFLARVRTVNQIRTLVRDGMKVADIVARARALIGDKTSVVWTKDELLQPVIPGDILLTVLEDEEDEEEEQDSSKLIAESVSAALKSSSSKQ